MSAIKKSSVLFVCMGNICRSPTAEGVFRRRVEEEGLADMIHIESAGTHAYHIGSAPDARSQEFAVKRGYDLSAQRARKVIASDFATFDYVLAMDRDNLALLQRRARPSIVTSLPCSCSSQDITMRKRCRILIMAVVQGSISWWITSRMPRMD
jgi:protein-tyrosine-phosphatase